MDGEGLQHSRNLGLKVKREGRKAARAVHGQTCSGSDEGSKKMEYSIYFGSDKRIDLPIYGVEQIITEWKFFYFFIQSFSITHATHFCEYCMVHKL